MSEEWKICRLLSSVTSVAYGRCARFFSAVHVHDPPLGEGQLPHLHRQDPGAHGQVAGHRRRPSPTPSGPIQGRPVTAVSSAELGTFGIY